jgi:hypothetical protein
MRRGFRISDLPILFGVGGVGEQPFSPRGDYLSLYTGNLDIMTAAVTEVGEEIANEHLSVTGSAHA